MVAKAKYWLAKNGGLFLVLFVVSLLALLALAGCGKMSEPYQDAERGDQNTDPADTITMPDGFSNVAAKCDGTTRVYVIFKGDNIYGSIAVSPNHPKCGGQ